MNIVDVNDDSDHHNHDYTNEKFFKKPTATIKLQKIRPRRTRSLQQNLENSSLIDALLKNNPTQNNNNNDNNNQNLSNKIITTRITTSNSITTQQQLYNQLYEIKKTLDFVQSQLGKIREDMTQTKVQLASIIENDHHQHRQHDMVGLDHHFNSSTVPTSKHVHFHFHYPPSSSSLPMGTDLPSSLSSSSFKPNSSTDPVGDVTEKQSFDTLKTELFFKEPQNVTLSTVRTFNTSVNIKVGDGLTSMASSSQTNEYHVAICSMKANQHIPLLNQQQDISGVIKLFQKSGGEDNNKLFAQIRLKGFKVAPRDETINYDDSLLNLTTTTNTFTKYFGNSDHQQQYLPAGNITSERFSDYALFGMHVHESADMSRDCQSAGSHYNPFNVSHGGPEDLIRHRGDLGNIAANHNGEVVLNIVYNNITLTGPYGILNRSIVVNFLFFFFLSDHSYYLFLDS